MNQQYVYGQYTSGQITYDQYQGICQAMGWQANDAQFDEDSGGNGSGTIRP